MKNKKRKIIGKKITIGLLGGSMNPPHLPHEMIARRMAEMFDIVYVIPCGHRVDKCTTNHTSIYHRLEMAKIAFGNIPDIRLDLSDLENDVFTSTFELQKKYQKIHPKAEIWHLIGEDIIAGGRKGFSEIQTKWDRGEYIWNNLNFLVVSRPDYGASQDDLPPHSKRLFVEGLVGSGTWIRRLVKDGRTIEGLVRPEIEEYIRKNRLYLD